MAVPTTGPYGTPILETFSATADPLPAPYVKGYASDNQLKSTGGWATSKGTGNGSGIRSDVTYTANHELWMPLPTLISGADYGTISLYLCTGHDAPGFRGYQLSIQYASDPTNNFIARIDNESYVSLRNVAGTLVAGGGVALARVGTSLEFWVHNGTVWSKADTIAESTYPTGQLGVGVDYDYVSVGPFGGGAFTIPRPKRTKVRADGVFSVARKVRRRTAGVFVEREIKPVGRFALPRPFAASSPFNVPVPSGPAVRSNSAAIISSAVTAQAARVLANADYGVSYAVARATDPLNTIGVYPWGYGADYDPGPFRIPADAAPAAGSDHHLATFYDGLELDQWVAVRQTASTWLAGSRYVYDTVGGSGIAPTDKVGPTAANFALTAGVIRPEDIARGVINHALVFTTSQTANYFVAPATHGDGTRTDAAAMPIGARIQLDPTLNVSALGIPAWQKVVARCLQVYGAFCVDSSGVFALRAETSIGRGVPDIWTAVGVTPDAPSFDAAFPLASLRVLDWS